MPNNLHSRLEAILSGREGFSFLPAIINGVETAMCCAVHRVVVWRLLVRMDGRTQDAVLNSLLQELLDFLSANLSAAAPLVTSEEEDVPHVVVRSLSLHTAPMATAPVEVGQRHSQYNVFPKSRYKGWHL